MFPLFCMLRRGGCRPCLLRQRHHFNSGLRAVFFPIGYLGWFVDLVVFVVSTLVLFAVLVRRQFFSAARQAVLGQPPGPGKN